MKILIVGGGKVGKYLADSLSLRHDVTLLERFEGKTLPLEEKPNIKIHIGAGCDPQVLESAGINQADVVIAATGDDEDNLVISQLAKNEFNVKKVIARVNNPKNQWLFTKKWGIDIAISSPHIILQLLEEELSLGDIVTLMKLKEGKVSLVELTIAENSQADGKKVRELELPKDSVIAVHLRNSIVEVPHGDTELKTGDNLLIVTNPKHEQVLTKIFGS